MFPGVSENLSMAIRRFIPPPEHRPKHEIEAEIREEIEFHLALTAERLAEEERLDTDSAKSEALKRFGDPESITRECTRIALKERIMLQRINTVLIALVAIGLIVVGIGTWQQQSQTAAAFEQINEKLTGLASPTPVERAIPEEPSPGSWNYVEVYAGDRRETVPLSPGLTVLDAVRQTIGNGQNFPYMQALRVDIYQDGRGGREAPIRRNTSVNTDYALESGNSVYVVGTDADLPWVLYSPKSDDQPAVEASKTRFFEAGPGDAEQISLQRLFDLIAEQLELRLVMNAQDVTDYEYTIDVTIPRAFLETLTIEQVLDYACLNVRSIDFDRVSWDIHDGALIVGSLRFIADRATVTATYRVDDLLGPFPSRDEYQDLREILTTAADFVHWRANGGTIGIYTEVEGRLSITTIPRFHREITTVLQTLHDPQRHYPRSTLRDQDWFKTWLALSNTTIGTGLTNSTTIVEAVEYAIDQADLPGHFAHNNLELIGFEGESPIGESPVFADSPAKLLTEWLGIASPDDFDRAGWMAYGGGIVVASERMLNSFTSLRVYDIGSFSSGSGDEFVESMIELIQTRVDFDGWRDNGGDTGFIQVFDDLLVITTTNINHIEIVRLLDEYRSANGETRSSEPSGDGRVVYISGGVDRPGVYQLARDSTMTVRQLIEVAGSYTIQPDSAQIAVTRTYADTGASRTWTFGPKHPDMAMPLEPGMTVSVSGEPPRQLGEPAPYQSEARSFSDEIDFVRSLGGGTVYIRGLVARPGTYAIPQGDTPFTVSRLIAAAGDVVGGNMSDPTLVYSVNRSSDATSETIFLDADRLSDFALRHDDLVQVARRPIQDGHDAINGADGSHP